MNKLPLFKTGDLLQIIKEALFDYDGIIESADRDLYESYSIDCVDVYENNEHYLDVTVLETKTHYPSQVGDIFSEVNNQFRIKVECIK